MATDDVVNRLILALQFRDTDGNVLVSANDLQHLLEIFDRQGKPDAGDAADVAQR